MIVQRFVKLIFIHTLLSVPILVGWVYVLFEINNHDYIIVGWIVWFLLGFLWIFVQPLAFYINYFLNDRKQKVEFNNEKREFYFTIEGQDIEISFDEILYLDQVYERSSWIHFLKPYYYRIITKNKEVFFFSRLWVTRLDEKIDFTVGKCDVAFPFIRKGF